ncbi:aldo/keto reductase [Pseudonocardia nigra]|uniref:aldo/keto reductase n=1 Tax=Pseudonocardia nigra TaxID=1921578 RepID=UPI001C601CE8|nr:aldo/keto reductase [Pseudonocardia nigra]
MVPDIPLNDGTTIPQLGFGTLNVPPERAPSEQNTAATAEIVGLALAGGYCHIDTAQMYGNEAGVGRAVAASGIPRDELYVTSKLGNGNHRPDDVRHSFAQTLDKLGLAELDLFLIHWPLPTLYDGDYVATWRAMTELVKDGRLRTQGVSNFQPDHLDRITSETGVVPAVNQIEVHPYFRNDAARAASAAHGIAVEAWSPLGQGAVLDDPVVGRIAAERQKTPAQVVLRWHIQHGHIVIPKSTRRERMEENISVFDFELSAEEMTAINALDKGADGRIGPNPDTFAWIP